LHDKPSYIKIQLKNKEVSACIHQMKIISTKRIYDRIQKVSQEQVNNLKNQIKEFYNL
jgi:hypothetical protein